MGASFTVYVKDDCQQCTATVRWLHRNSQDWVELDAVGDSDLLLEWGYRSAPVVVAPDGKKWSGFRPDLLTEYL